MVIGNDNDLIGVIWRVYMDFWKNMERLNDYNVMAGLRNVVTENWFFLFMTVFPISFLRG